MFLFKLHAPRNVIVGGGIFAYANALPCSLAWKAFREANGARSAQEMRSRIARYRRVDPTDRTDFGVGCRILTQPFFFGERDWIPMPASWSPNIVSFKTYNTGNADGLALWEAVIDRLNQPQIAGMTEEPSRFGEPHLIRPRLGQGAFRVLVTDIYQRRCAITQERALPALEAAHIRPYSDGGAHEAPNGLLLRRDIHSLFDAGDRRWHCVESIEPAGIGNEVRPLRLEHLPDRLLGQLRMVMHLGVGNAFIEQPGVQLIKILEPQIADCARYDNLRRTI